ncbi:MAG: YARHG domain-containing protein [Candidatus Eremiobacteraeota bacterium]|nr:YARHG domain-containing protein [Candidatus Eremiobacteraeota bacterium]MCW5868835.1 YARHG domain-containing protein [Candidatus Eremiobacteraeota bacterium]
MADFVSVLPEGDELLSHQEADGYALALVHDAEEETDGTALLRQDPGGWTLLSRVGGTFSAEDLHRLGVPPKLWNRLLIEPVGESEREEALNSGPGWPFTEEMALAEEDVAGLTDWERMLMASEILARRGCPFDESPLREYFQMKAWYDPDPDFDESDLSELERANLAFLR